MRTRAQRRPGTGAARGTRSQASPRSRAEAARPAPRVGDSLGPSLSPGEPGRGFRLSDISIHSAEAARRFHREIPIAPLGPLRPGVVTPELRGSIDRLGAGRPLPQPEQREMRRAGARRPERARVHDDARSRGLARFVGSEAFTVGSDIVLGDPRDASLPRDRLVAHEAAHAVQQEGGRARAAGGVNALEREADAFAAAPPGKRDSTWLSGAPEGLANRVIWRQTQKLPGNMLFVLDVDDGDFVGGCVRQTVPHVGAKIIRKGVPRSAGNLVMNIHLGVMTNPAGRRCVFFYESVTGFCETLCADDIERVLRSIAKLAAWILAAAVLAGLAYLAAAALAAASAPALAAAAVVLLVVVGVGAATGGGGGPTGGGTPPPA